MLNCEEVKINLHYFLSDNLDKVTQKEMESHLNSCDACFERYNKTVSILDKLKDLPETIDLQFNIREKFSEELLKRSGERKLTEAPIPRISTRKLQKEQARLEKELKKSRQLKRKTVAIKTNLTRPREVKFALFTGMNKKKFILAFLPLILLAVSYTAYDYLKINSPWEVEWNFGGYMINGIENANLKLSKNEILRTMDSSRVVLFVPQTGRIEINSNSSVTLLNPKSGDNIISLHNGEIKIITTATIPYFKIKFKNYTIRDIGGVFTVTLKGNGNTNIFVDFGMVEIYYNGNSLKVDEGYNCEILMGKKPGTPFRFDASDSLKQMVRLFDENGEADNTIESIVEQSNTSDALTLLSLIPKVSPIKRQIIFQKISNFFPPPKEVTRMGIVTLDMDMIEAWWNEIEWQI